MISVSDRFVSAGGQDWTRLRAFGPLAAAASIGGSVAVAALLRIPFLSTGLSPDDLTPEETLPLLEREVPGIMEAIRRAGAAKTPLAPLSRGHAGTAGRTFIVNLPGSPSGVMDGLTVLDPLIGHICDQAEGAKDGAEHNHGGTGHGH